MPTVNCRKQLSLPTPSTPATLLPLPTETTWQVRVQTPIAGTGSSSKPGTVNADVTCAVYLYIFRKMNRMVYWFEIHTREVVCFVQFTLSTRWKWYRVTTRWSFAMFSTQDRYSKHTIINCSLATRYNKNNLRFVQFSNSLSNTNTNILCDKMCEKNFKKVFCLSRLFINSAIIIREMESWEWMKAAFKTISETVTKRPIKTFNNQFVLTIWNEYHFFSILQFEHSKTFWSLIG